MLWELYEAETVALCKKMIKPGNVIVIEWLEKVKEILEQFKNRKNVQLVWVKMEYSSENKRRIAVLDNRS